MWFLIIVFLVGALAMLMCIALFSDGKKRGISFDKSFSEYLRGQSSEQPSYTGQYQPLRGMPKVQVRIKGSGWWNLLGSSNNHIDVWLGDVQRKLSLEEIEGVRVL